MVKKKVELRVKKLEARVTPLPAHFPVYYMEY
jgi:hypothetical protein